MDPLPAEATPMDVFAVYLRWRHERKAGLPGDERDRALVVQAALLWAAELAAVVRPKRCFFCQRQVPSVFVVDHAVTCDVGPVVRRWRLAANETTALAEALPEAERRAAPDPWAMLTMGLRPNHVEQQCKALPPDFLLRAHAEAALVHLVGHVTPAPLATRAVLSMDRLGEVAKSPGAPKTPEAALDLFGAMLFARLALDDGPPTHCAWCDVPLGAEPLEHLAACPQHPLFEQLEVLEDWCTERRGETRHPCVDVLRRLHEWRSSLRLLLAACEGFADEFGWNGAQGTVRGATEARFDEWRRAVREVAERPAPVVDAAAGTTLHLAQRSALEARTELCRLLGACDQFVNRLRDDVGGRVTIDESEEAQWKTARAAAEAFLRYPAPGWRDTPKEPPPPREFLLASLDGEVVWRTGQPLLQGPALIARLKWLAPRAPPSTCIRYGSDQE